MAGAYGFRWPVLSLGLRLFYLLAACWAVLAVPLWWLLWSGTWSVSPALPALFWHAHEMLFGFAEAVIWGFLLTAVGNWTQQPTATGGKLALLGLLWLSARLALWCGPLWLAEPLDLLLIPAVMSVLIPPIIKKRQYRNLFVLGVGLVLESLNLCFFYNLHHPERLYAIVYGAFGVIITLETIITGRVVPMFSRNMAGVTLHFQSALFERLLSSLTAVSALLLVVSAPPVLILLVCPITVAAHVVRLWNWQPWKVRHYPLLWVLYLGSLSIPLGFVAAIFHELQALPLTAVLHTWAFGMVILMSGMMTRSAMGHTGRPLQSDHVEQSMYLCLLLAGVLRLSPYLVPAAAAHFSGVLLCVVLLWDLAFLLFLRRYGPWLMALRADALVRYSAPR